MATQRQIEANRLNAQKSTGPRTPEGKAAVRFNALKHGLDARVLVIPGEDQDELDALNLEYYEQFRPETPVARYLVDTLVQCDWNRRRLLRLQANIIRSLCGEGSSDSFARADRAALGSAPLDRVFRQLNALDRQYFRAFAELRRPSEQPPAAEIGFVPPDSVGQAVSPAGGHLAALGGSTAQTASLDLSRGPAPVGQVANLRPVANRPESASAPTRPAIGFVPPDSVGQAVSPAGAHPAALGRSGSQTASLDLSRGPAPVGQVANLRPVANRPEPASAPPRPAIGFVPPTGQTSSGIEVADTPVTTAAGLAGVRLKATSGHGAASGNTGRASG